MALDHGILNVPLSKRGNIDAQIDRYKDEQARTAKAAAAELHKERQAARAALGEASYSQLTGLASKLGLTIIQTRARLRSQCIASPSLVIRFLGESRGL